jgi:hypothetical protein
MADGRFLTDYRSANTREQYNKTINGYGLAGDNQFRMFLQQNGEQIMDSEWNFYIDQIACKPTCCVHTNPTRTTSGDNFEELKTYDAIRQNKLKPSDKAYPSCAKMADYRLTHTQNSAY